MTEDAGDTAQVKVPLSDRPRARARICPPMCACVWFCAAAQLDEDGSAVEEVWVCVRLVGTCMDLWVGRRRNDARFCWRNLTGCSVSVAVGHECLREFAVFQSWGPKLRSEILTKKGAAARDMTVRTSPIKRRCMGAYPGGYGVHP